MFQIVTARDYFKRKLKCKIKTCLSEKHNRNKNNERFLKGHNNQWINMHVKTSQNYRYVSDAIVPLALYDIFVSKSSAGMINFRIEKPYCIRIYTGILYVIM